MFLIFFSSESNLAVFCLDLLRWRKNSFFDFSWARTQISHFFCFSSKMAQEFEFFIFLAQESQFQFFEIFLENGSKSNSFDLSNLICAKRFKKGKDSFSRTFCSI